MAKVFLCVVYGELVDAPRVLAFVLPRHGEVGFDLNDLARPQLCECDGSGYTVLRQMGLQHSGLFAGGGHSCYRNYET